MAPRHIVVAVALAALNFPVATATATEGPIVEGPLEADQSVAGADETSSTPGTPAPVSGSGPPGSFTRELWSEEEVGGENGLSVISSTAAGTFALTGVVFDDSTTAAVTGANVYLIDPFPLCHRAESTSPSHLEPAGPGDCGTARTVASTTTDSQGAFAFINMPPAPYLHLRVDGSGFGTYQLLNGRYLEDETYVSTIELGPTAQTFDESGTKADSTLSAATAGSGYDSNGRVPPTLLVAQYPQASDCSVGGSLRTVRRFPWRFYVLHTMSGEIFGTAFPGGAFKIEAAKAIAQAIQSYAWYHRVRGGNAAGGADVDNTTQFQCFKPHRPVRRSWRTWVGDILDERIADSNNDIQLTQYRAGTYNCVEGGIHAPDGNILSQLGSRRARNNAASTTGAASTTTTTPDT